VCIRVPEVASYLSFNKSWPLRRLPFGVSAKEEGTVTLVRAAFSPSKSSAVARSASGRHRIPFDDRPRSEQAVVNRPQPVSADQEEILHYAMHGREALQVGS
jgi:hypothetical protein